MTNSKRRKIVWIDIGQRPYREVWEIQKELRGRRIRGEIPDLVIFCEHDPVFTVGKQKADQDWLTSPERIEAEGIEIVRTERGGKITYHGPGQLVGYLIIDINSWRIGVKELVRQIEEAGILFLRGLGLKGERDPEYPGVWWEQKKLMAIGLNVSRGVTMHGWALNLEPNLDHYRHIVPCGICQRKVTSVREELAERTPSREEAIERFVEIFSDLFQSN